MISFPLAIESWDTIEYFVRVRRGEVALDRPNWEPGLGAQSGFTAAATAEAFRRAGRPDLAMTIVEDELDASERTDDLVFAVDIGVQAALDLRDPGRARAVLDRLEPATSDHHLATEMRCVARVERDGALAMRSAEVAGASGYHLSELESLALAAGLGSLDADGCRDARRRIEAVGDPELLRQIDTAMLRRSVRIDLVQDSAEMSPLEQLIVDGVRRGQTNAEIAAELGVSAHVVGNRLRGLFRRHGVANRAELAATFVAGG